VALVEEDKEMQDVHGSVKVSFKCPASYKEEFKDSHCLLVISVGQAAHEGEIFRSTIQLINRSFRECTILVADSLQRYTLAIGNNYADEILYAQSIHEGDLWLERNRKIYDKFTIPYNVTRWDPWLERADYEQQKEMVNTLYEIDEKIKHIFHMEIEIFLKRYQSHINNIFNYDKAFKFCLDYLKEECSVMGLLAHAAYDFELYPRSRGSIMLVIYKKLVEPRYFGKLRSVSLSVKPGKTEVKASPNVEKISRYGQEYAI
jgi:hypothetical protein